jgi:hypothetical protein
VALYWAQGSKDKTYARRERAIFINSDPGVVALCLTWLDLLGVARESLRFRVSIHEPADVEAADLYRRIEGWWYGIVGAATSDDPLNRT